MRRLNLTAHLVAVGEGQRPFEDTLMQPLLLASQETFSTRVLNLAYARADARRRAEEHRPTDEPTPAVHIRWRRGHPPR